MDLVMLDIKHTDPIIHKKYTGVDNKLILENLDFLCSSTTKFIIRVPLIPGVNDTEENMENIAELVQYAKSLIRIEILPYNQVAGAKYSMIGQEFNPLFNPMQKVKIHNVFEKRNIKSIVI
jgi:pyruvate formate lyase activating enzyme